MKTKNEILGNLYYNLGKQVSDFRIFHNYVVEGEKKFSKWINYLSADESDIDQATHRTLLHNEVVLDYDPVSDETFQHLTSKVKKVCYDLKKKGVEYECYFTGSRGYHIHVFVKDMFFLNKIDRQKFRINMIKFFGAELQKNSEGTAIALEGVSHWKTGKLKTRCDW